MRSRTAVVLVALILGLVAFVIFSVGLGSGGTLQEVWVSDTPRDNTLNHHAVGVGPDGDVVVAPVAEVPNAAANVTDDSCVLARLAPDDGAVQWRDGVPAADCFTHALTEPTVVDVDRDGTLEVVVATTEDAVVVHDAATGREEARIPTATYGYARPTVAEVASEHGPEIVASDIDGTLVVGRPDGSVRWRLSLAEHFESSTRVEAAPAVDDVDADGETEIAVGTAAGPAVVGPGGTVEWTSDGGATHLAVAPADGDQPATLLTATGGVVRSLDGRNGTVQWERQFPAIAELDRTADGDGDGVPEVYVGLASGEVLALDAASGQTEWSSTVSTADDATVSSPDLADVDGDDTPEVVAAARDGTVVVLDAGSGRELAAYQRSVQVWTAPTPTDLGDDGDQELLVRYGDGRVVALNYAS